MNVVTISDLSEKTGLSRTVIESIIVDCDIPCVQIGEESKGRIYVDYDKFKEAFENINVQLKLRTQERRRKNREKTRKWYNENSKEEIEKARQRGNVSYNTFGRNGQKRGNCGMLKRDYELTSEELERRNSKRASRKDRSGEKKKGYSVLIMYDRFYDSLHGMEYASKMSMEYERQKRCAIKGKLGKKKPSEHFLFDFDLELMLKDGMTDKHGNKMERWWKGEIRHWTVNDGIWKE